MPTIVSEGGTVVDLVVDAARGSIRETRRAASEANLKYQRGADDLMANFAANEDRRASARVHRGGAAAAEPDESASRAVHRSGTSFPAPAPAAYELELAERVRLAALARTSAGAGEAEAAVLPETAAVGRCRLNRCNPC